MTPVKRSAHSCEPFVWQGTFSVSLQRARDRETHKVVHVGSAKHEDADVVCPLEVVNRSAVLGVVRSIEEPVIWACQAYTKDPVPRCFRPICIGLIASVHCQPSSNIEKTAVGDCVFVIVTIVKRENLPLQASATRGGIPPQGLRIEHSLCKSQPLR